MGYVMGLMSGTSMDGIDVAVLGSDMKELVYGMTLPYPDEVIDTLMPVMQGQPFDMCHFAKLNQLLGQSFADAAARVMKEIDASRVQVIGCHGQTVCHNTSASLAYTWQMGSPYPLLKRFGIPVVYDFRSKNVAQGGQGAPLAPLYHQYLSSEENCVWINIGGISNISVIKPSVLIGYDIGPGNCFMDAWALRHLQQHYDDNGDFAAQGNMIPGLLEALLNDPYYSKTQPKSIGKEYFTLAKLDALLQDMQYRPCDVQATFLALTIQTISDAVHHHLASGHKVIICGGGAHNRSLMQGLKTSCHGYDVMSSTDYGVSADYLEAMMIAWLADARMKSKKFRLADLMGGIDNELLGIICE